LARGIAKRKEDEGDDDAAWRRVLAYLIGLFVAAHAEMLGRGKMSRSWWDLVIKVDGSWRYRDVKRETKDVGCGRSIVFCCWGKKRGGIGWDFVN